MPGSRFNQALSDADVLIRLGIVALALSTAQRLANCSLTTYVTGRDGRLNLEQDAWIAPLEEEDAPVTKAHDVPVAPR